MPPVRSNGDGVELEGQPHGVQFWVEMAGLLRSLHSPSDSADPLMHDRGNAVAHNAQAAVEFERSGGEEASALEDSFFDEDQPMINQSPKPRHALGSSDGRERHFLDKNLGSHFNGGELQFFLRAKVGKEPALAHA